MVPSFMPSPLGTLQADRSGVHGLATGNDVWHNGMTVQSKTALYIACNPKEPGNSRRGPGASSSCRRRVERSPRQSPKAFKDLRGLLIVDDFRKNSTRFIQHTYHYASADCKTSPSHLNNMDPPRSSVAALPRERIDLSKACLMLDWHSGCYHW